MKKRLIAGDRPTGKLHIGHYVGTLRPRVELQNNYETWFFRTYHVKSTSKMPI
ncbi:hypothetical protein IQ232_17065 [Microcystis aeruginosa LEGE 11464]|uniref:hypothetical protein n=1 Tax=Microcystis aeruginosa TaxID=1126 RepID=UPI00187E0847|nr:hypothetical protein [Microcystis aeruginosa]MBE9091396.1 hypothetical protein [Microcystis aeruginosa LEGE 11464]